MSDLNEALKQLKKDIALTEQAVEEHESQDSEVEEVGEPKSSTAHTFILAFIGSFVGLVAGSVLSHFI